MTLTLTPAVSDTFTNESHKIKSFDDINEDEMTTLESRNRAIQRDKLV
jgi:hypothetical protein